MVDFVLTVLFKYAAVRKIFVVDWGIPMKRTVMTAVAASALLASASIGFAANGDVVKNGNFSSGLGDWNVSGGTVTSQSSQDYVDHAGGSGNSGTGLFAAFGAGDNPSGTLSQVLSTVIGGLYTVSFNYGGFGSQGGNAQTLTATAAGSSSSFTVGTGQLTSALNYVMTSAGAFTFTATSTSTLLSFIGSGATASADLLLDNVKVVGPVAVPGPEAGAGLGALALGGMALWMKRRRRLDVAAAV